MADLSLKLDESADLTFSVNITGTEKTIDVPSVRLIFEDTDCSYVFNGKFTGRNEVEVNIPPMNGRIKEGVYGAKMEVILSDKVFKPLNFLVEFKQTTKVVAEIAQKHSKESIKTTKPEVKASLPIVKTLKEKYGSRK